MNNEQLVEAVTAIIMQRIAAAEAAEAGCPAGKPDSRQVVTFGEVPGCLVGDGYEVRAGYSASDVDGADYIILTAAAFRAFHGGTIPAGLAGAPTMTAGGDCCGAATTHDLTGKRLIAERDVLSLNLTSGAKVKVAANAIVTSLARDIARSRGADIVR